MSHSRSIRAETRSRHKDEIKRAMHSVGKVRRWEKKWVTIADTTMQVLKWIPLRPDEQPTHQERQQQEPQESQEQQEPQQQQQQQEFETQSILETNNFDENGHGPDRPTSDLCAKEQEDFGGPKEGETTIN